MKRPHLVLLGGGHAHVQVLESLAKGGWPSVRVTLVSPDRDQFYTGMVPGYVQSQYETSDLSISLPSLCNAAGAEFLAASGTRVDAESSRVETTEGVVEYDLLSLDIGSVTMGRELPGVQEHAIPVRPLENATELRRRLEELSEGARVVVVGGGAGGVELAFAAGRMGLSVVVIERGADVLENYPGAARRKARNLFDQKGIELLVGREVAWVSPRVLRLTNGEEIEADVVIWATGPAAPPLIAESDLPRDHRGFMQVDRALRVAGGDRIWGAGDCVRVDDLDLPKAGVYAVRQGAVLAQNLRQALEGREGSAYRPQRAFLSLLNTADGRALGRWRGVVVHGRAMWWLKDWIDRRWVERFQGLSS